MRAIVSILSATLVGSLWLQCYLAIWHPSSFGRFAEFPVILFFAACIVSSAFLLFVSPSFVWLRRTQRRLSRPASFIAGLVIGCLVMLLFMALAGWPVRVAEVAAGGVAGALGVSIYSTLTFKQGA
jgi:small-conductance mechanosensitive channel